MPSDRSAANHLKPKHKPYLTAGAMFQIGLGPMEPARWLDTGPDHAPFMAQKRERLQGDPPLFYGAMPQSLAAQAELHDCIVAHLLAEHSHIYGMRAECLLDGICETLHRLGEPGRQPLSRIGHMIEEDFILIQNIGGRDLISAASNAYTSSGRIVSSVGHDMPWAHEPVPQLNTQLGGRIDRILANIHVGKPVVRFNWFVTAIGDRLYPHGAHHGNATAPEGAAQVLALDHRRAGDLLFVRTERQTFVRLPETGALAFGIHTYSDPLSSLADDRESLAAMHRLIGEYSESRQRYSGLPAIKVPLLKWIEDRLQ